MAEETVTCQTCGEEVERREDGTVPDCGGTSALDVVDRRRFAIDRPLTQQDVTDQQIPAMERAMVLRTPMAEQVARHLVEIKGRPLGDKILILPLPPDDRYGSILFADNAKEDQTCGIVVASGRGRYENGVLIPPEVKPGNYVSFSRYAAREVEAGGVKLFQISEADISFAAGE